MADTTAPALRHTKTFKKYTSEYEPAVVEAVRQWAKISGAVVMHEDKSIVKVTASQERIAALLSELKARFNYIPPEDREEAKPAGDSDAA